MDFEYRNDMATLEIRQQLTMAISNCLFSPTSENPRGFSVWRLLEKLTANPHNYS